MPGPAKWYLVCYDVRDEKRLRRAAKCCEGYGERVQYSVFRCHLTAGQIQQFRHELTQELESEDDVLFIPICERCIRGMQTTHSSQKKPDWPEAPPSHRIV